MAIKISSAKAKGKRLERLVRDRIRDLYPDIHPDNITSPVGAQQGSDLVLTPLAQEVIKYDFEMKAYKSFSFMRCYEQGKKNTRDDAETLLVTREDRGEVMVTMRLDHFLELLSTAQEHDSMK